MLTIFCLLLLMFSCTPKGKLSSDHSIEREKYIDPYRYCDSLDSYRSFFMKRIQAEISVGEEVYDARLSVYYQPDSVFIISAVNAGFEMVRLGIYKDSTVYINRLEKVVYIMRESKDHYEPPVSFDDLELLLNQVRMCKSLENSIEKDSLLLLNRSTQDVVREVAFSRKDLALVEFQFFQKKTGEYIIGENSDQGKILLYSNYIVPDLIIQAEKGEITYDRMLNVNTSVNRDKYDIIYLK